MTEDERRHRNPKVETVRTTRAEIEGMPVVGAAELELHRVYVLQSERFITTLNYMGKRHAIHAVTFDEVTVHHFHGPRAAVDVFLCVNPGGWFSDAVGRRITVRKWTGEDA